MSHSAVQNCTVQATTSGRWGDFTTAVDGQSVVVDFDIENCELIAAVGPVSPGVVVNN